jgi:hypothetical protein
MESSLALHRRDAMRVRVLLQISKDGSAGGAAEEVAVFAKATDRLEDVGLSIAESKALLAVIQRWPRRRGRPAGRPAWSYRSPR